MNERARKRLEAAGARVTTVQEFLDLSDADMTFIEMKLALAKKLRECRKAAALAEEQVAKRVGSSQSRVAKMEAGDPTVTMDLLVGSLLRLGAGPHVVARPSNRQSLQQAAQQRWQSPGAGGSGEGDSEEKPKEVVAAELVMFRKVREECGERTDAQRIVARNREVVLALPPRGQAMVAAGLAGHLVSEASECSGEIVASPGRGAASRGDDFFTDEMKAEYLGFLTLVEVAAHGVPDLRVKTGQVVGFGEDCLPKGAGSVATLRSLLDDEKQLAHEPLIIPSPSPT